MILEFTESSEDANVAVRVDQIVKMERPSKEVGEACHITIIADEVYGLTKENKELLKRLGVKPQTRYSYYAKEAYPHLLEQWQAGLKEWRQGFDQSGAAN